MSELLEIDGSVLEGGGQILRNSISLSAILGIPIKVTKIRAGRSKPGLAAQHLKGIQLVASMCQAKLKGDTIGSTEIEFVPGPIKGGRYSVDVQTAGSVSLLIQVALPCALLADSPVTLDLKGGTNADMAPQIDYMTEVFKQVLLNFGGNFDVTIHRRGYFPKGGGHVTVNITPVKGFKNATITERGDIEYIVGWCFVAGTLPLKMAYEMADGAKCALRGERVSIECYKENRSFAPDNCNGIIIKCKMSSGVVLGADALWRRGAEPAAAGGAAGHALYGQVHGGACVDTHTQDQIIIYMALASGRSVVRAGDITLHTKTAIHVAELMTKVKFNITPDGGQNLIECEGIGFTNDRLNA